MYERTPSVKRRKTSSERQNATSGPTPQFRTTAYLLKEMGCRQTVFVRSSDKMFTTSEEDKRDAARLKEKLKLTQSGTSPPATSGFHKVPNVTLADGAHKYVLMSAIVPGGGERQNFVVSKRGASYHKDAAEPMVESLMRSGYKSIDILGGGRILLDEEKKKISIFGYSYSFGRVSCAKEILGNILSAYLTFFLNHALKGGPRP